MADYYEILGVARAAGASEIRQAYMRLAKQRHPDLFTDPQEKARAQSFFQDLTTAFNTLFNEKTRAAYDQESEKKKPTTPEEAARIWAENQGEITPDPKGGSYIHGDAFDTDARVYYRLLRRDYEKTPRPSEKGKRSVSHHLHGIYNKLPGTRGW